MKSVRLGPERELRLEQASLVVGRSQSEVIRAAIDNYCDAVIAQSLALVVAPHVGAVSGRGASVSRRTSGAFTEQLLGDGDFPATQPPRR